MRLVVRIVGWSNLGVSYLVKKLMAKNLFAFIGLWVVIAATQSLVAKCQRAWAQEQGLD